MAKPKMENEEIKELIKDSVSEVLTGIFGEGQDAGRFIDVTRIPLICQDISGIHIELKKMNDNSVTKTEFWPVKTLVYGFVAIVMTAVILAIVSFILAHIPKLP